MSTVFHVLLLSIPYVTAYTFLSFCCALVCGRIIATLRPIDEALPAMAIDRAAPHRAGSGSTTAIS